MLARSVQVASIGADGSAGSSSDGPGGPLWSRFFSSFGGASTSASAGDHGGDGDTESVLSESAAPTSSVIAPPGTPAMPKHLRHDSTLMTPSSEIGPNDSASAVGEDNDDLSELAGKGTSGRPANKRKGISSAKTAGSALERSSEAAAAIAHDDGTYLFKFLSPGGTTHRFVARSSDFSNLREIIAGKLATDPFFSSQTLDKSLSSSSAGPLDPSDFSVHYTDDDADLVLLSSGGDLEDAVRTARKQGKDRVLLIIKGGKGWENAVQNQAAHFQQQAQAHNAALKAVQEEDAEDEQELEKNNSTRGKKVKADSSSSGADDQLVLGFLSKDMVLPAAIAFLGVAVIGVFALSRSSKH